MPVELRTQRDGRIRKSWYGRYEVHGRRQYVNLGVKVTGTPPASLSLKDEGDTVFERSRAVAIAKLEGIVEEARSRNNAAHLVERLYEIKTGEAIKSVALVDLPEEWAKIPRKRKPDARYASQCKSALLRFATFMRKENCKADELAHVTRTLARAFMDAESERGITAKTWNDTLKLLRATCKYLLPAGAINPFSDMPTRETETVFRKPFSPEELKEILEAAREDEFIRPLLVTGMCTAMRRGDCCLLKWKDVDLDRRFITVKTAKTGQMVSIPIFPMLEEELRKRSGKGIRHLTQSPHPQPLSHPMGEGGCGLSPIGAERVGFGGTPKPAGGTPALPLAEGFVFPDQAKMYRDNPDGITYRVRKVLVTALREMGEEGFGGTPKPAGGTPALPSEEKMHPLTPALSPKGAREHAHGTPPLPSPHPSAGHLLPSAEKGNTGGTSVPREEVMSRGLEYISGLPEGDKKERMRAVFERYVDGQKLCDAAEGAGVSKGSASNYLNEVEKATQCAVVRGRAPEGGMAAMLRKDGTLLRAERETGKRRASVRDFHSFRVTWVTLALTAGVPLELVQKVTGHKTTDVVLKHYFQPDREAFREALQTAMPKLLTSGGKLGAGGRKTEGGGRKAEASSWEREKAAMREVIEGMTAKTWGRDRKRLLELVGKDLGDRR